MRHLDWEGCFNARTLGRLKTNSGAEVRQGALVRSDALDRLTVNGWEALWNYGVRTIIDLRNDDERTLDAHPRPEGLTTLHLPHDAFEERDFWDVWASGPQFGTPLYYGPHLRRFPERSAQVLQAIANAVPGGVLFHCSIGRDRSGLIAILLLRVLNVGTEDIVNDHMMSTERLPPLFERRGVVDQEPEIECYLKEQGTSRGKAIEDLLDTTNIERTLEQGGLQKEELMRLRTRALSDVSL